MNRNIDGDWHMIKDIPYGDIADELDQSTMVTNSSGLLKVLRDYKHFFKIRSYVNGPDGKVYCPDPSYTYTHARNDTAAYNINQTADPYNTEYVMWGARQVTPTELVKIATLVIAWGVDQSGGGSRWNWQSLVGGYTLTTNNNGSSGTVYAKSSSGVGMWWFDFSNYKPDMDINSNKGDWAMSVTFVTIDTNSNMGGSSTTQTGRTIFAESNSAGYAPNFYGYLPSTYNSNREYGKDFFDVKGPLDVPNLYTAKMRFYSDVVTNVTTGVWPFTTTHSCRGFKWGGGTNNGYVEVKYPSDAATSEKVYGAEENTPLSFKDHDSARRNSNVWY
jgi:hypothetical protein